MDDVTTSLLRGLEKEATENQIATKEASSSVLRDLKTKNPQLMAADVNKLNDIEFTIVYGNNSAESPSFKKYYHQLKVGLFKQISSEVGKFLNQRVTESELKKLFWIDRYAQDNQLNGICHAPKKEIDKIHQIYDEFQAQSMTDSRDMFIQSINEQARHIGQPVLPDIRITLAFPTSSTTNILVYYAEAGVLKADYIYRLPSVTLDTNVFCRMKQGAFLAPAEIYKKCPVDLAVTQRIRDDLPFDSSDEQYLTDNCIRKIPSIMRCCFDSKSKRFLLNPEYDKPGCTEFLKMAESIIEGMKKNGGKPPEYLDWDHLHAHYISGRDIFVTEDSGILKIGSQLKVLGMRVMRFEKLLKYIRDKRVQLYTINPENPKIQ